jgi:hypothetical protein
MSSISGPAPGSSSTSPGVDANALLAEVNAFLSDCQYRLAFNTRWDNLLNVAGILLSVAIIASGAFEMSRLTTILGGLVAAIVTAQRAFPFGPRAQFYRVLVGQTANLVTDIRAGAQPTVVATTLKSLRLDFAQQLPRGNSFKSDESETPQGRNSS